ncbi:MAG TPA: molybdopterin-dependent oxidoreductase [Streptosporangiaceae bacterium]|nr:molybdopterin-dependent oxidoreductase [Streptosporangiaceae bacterium]
MTLDKRPAGNFTRGAAAGILAGGLALGVAQLVAGLITSGSSPVVAVGQLSIDYTPAGVKNFAISAFGSHDKVVLVGGILVILAVFAAAIGVLAVRRLAYGMTGLGVFILVGLIAALSRPNASGSDALPTLLGGVAAALALRRLARLAAQQPAGAASAGSTAGAAPRALPEYRPLSGQAPPAEAAGAPPGAGQPDGERPAAERPDSERPAAEQASAGGPVGERPAEQPTAGRPDTERPAAGQPGSERPGARDPEAPDGPAASLPDEWRQPLPGPRPAGRGRPAAGRLASTPPRPAGPRRRSFLATGAAVAGGAIVAGVGGNLLAERGNVSAARSTLRIPKATVPAPPLPPGTDLKIPGLSPFITPNSQFYRVDTAIVLPEITPASWKLRIHGMVAREMTLTFDDLIRRPLIEDYITLTCVSDPVAGPYVGNAKWLGASLRSLLQEAGIRAGAEQLLCTSTDGFTSGTPVAVSMDGRDAMLAVAMNGTVLPVEHGFPVRLVVPGLYGYVSACKWITDIEVTTYRASRAYWAVRGWDQQAPIKTESRIDVPLAPNLKAGTHQIAGVAWAQHKGIEAVEVRIDNGPWHEARLAAVPDIDTWRQWAYAWDAAPGNHLIESRATDRTGYTQTALQEPPEPNGATGFPMTQVTVS